MELINALLHVLLAVSAMRPAMFNLAVRAFDALTAGSLFHEALPSGYALMPTRTTNKPTRTIQYGGRIDLDRHVPLFPGTVVVTMTATTAPTESPSDSSSSSTSSTSPSPYDLLPLRPSTTLFDRGMDLEFHRMVEGNTEGLRLPADSFLVVFMIFMLAYQIFICLQMKCKSSSSSYHTQSLTLFWQSITHVRTSTPPTLSDTSGKEWVRRCRRLLS
jgi:hypothetical protein